MNIGQKSFLFFIFFILGVLLSSFGVPLIYILAGEGILFLSCIFLGILKSNHRLLSAGFLTLVIFAGGFYARTYEYITFDNVSLPYGQKTEISGTVNSYPQTSEKSQSFEIKTDSGYLISVRTNFYQQVSYGDRILIEGITKPLNNSTDYLKKDGIVGTVDYPVFIYSEKSSGFSIKNLLYSVKDSFTEVFKKTLNRDESALMSGILLGQEGAGFSKDFKQAMKNSGTTHLVALSGYNITILIFALFFVLSFVFSRNANFWVSMGATLLFVLMTGAQSSVVRAAFMGSLAVIARQLSRVYDFRQAMAFSAFLMVVFNPMVLRFDAGFVLSFLSLAGITYITPVLSSFFSFKRKLTENAKKLFFETFSAQLAVLPVLVVYFGGFSFVGVVSNVLVLPLIPLTMFVGFFTGFVGIVWMPLAHIGSFILTIPLKFEVWVINFFGSFSQVQVEFGMMALAIYYLLILAFLFKFRNRIKDERYAI